MYYEIAKDALSGKSCALRYPCFLQANKPQDKEEVIIKEEIKKEDVKKEDIKKEDIKKEEIKKESKS